MIESFTVDTWVSIGTAIGGIVVGAVTAGAYIKKKLYDLKKAEMRDGDIMDMDVWKHSVIHENITELRLETDADRCQVGQFHNGGKFLDGTPMKKFSITHESCGAGQRFEFQSMQAVLTSMFCDMIEAVKEDEPSIILTDSLPESSATKTHNQSKNIQAFAVLPIRKKELFIGFIRVEWTDLSSLPQSQEKFEQFFVRYRNLVEFELGKKG